MKAFFFFITSTILLGGCQQSTSQDEYSTEIDSVAVIQTIFQDSIFINKINAPNVSFPTLVYSKVIPKEWPFKILGRDIPYIHKLVDEIENNTNHPSDIPINHIAVTGFSLQPTGALSVTVRLVGGGWVLRYILQKNSAHQWQIVQCVRSFI